ncbi:MAG: hypothetical protein QF824_02095 [Candidatus Woesearchaeota archaeon]|jgi:hypothetical protein|nr:hypothetical protein [Candidatus Woesearchaeota archaeon]
MEKTVKYGFGVQEEDTLLDYVRDLAETYDVSEDEVWDNIRTTEILVSSLVVPYDPVTRRPIPINDTSPIDVAASIINKISEVNGVGEEDARYDVLVQIVEQSEEIPDPVTGEKIPFSHIKAIGVKLTKEFEYEGNGAANNDFLRY